MSKLRLRNPVIHSRLCSEWEGRLGLHSKSTHFKANLLPPAPLSLLSPLSWSTDYPESSLVVSSQWSTVTNIWYRAMSWDIRRREKLACPLRLLTSLSNFEITVQSLWPMCFQTQTWSPLSWRTSSPQSFIQQTFTEYLLCAGPCPRYWGYNEDRTGKALALMQLLF